MANLGVYIIEDEVLYANKLMLLIDELGYELLGSSDNSDTAYAEILSLKPDLLLVDINISGTMDGIELASKLNVEHIYPTIFITSFSDRETFERAKEAKPYAYVTKPFEADSLQRTIELVFNAIEHQSSGDRTESAWAKDVVFRDSIFVKSRHRIHKVKVAEILYLEVEDRYSTIYTEGGKKFVLRMSMGEVQEKLPIGDFARTHRKYSVNVSKITSIDTQDNLIYINDICIPISRSHKETLLEQLDWMQ